MKTKITTLLLAALVLAVTAQAEWITITGKVISASDNSSIKGVHIENTITGQKTQTDKNGEFAIEADYGHVLKLSKSQFEDQEYVVGKETHVTFMMVQKSKEVIVRESLQKHKYAKAEQEFMAQPQSIDMQSRGYAGHGWNSGNVTDDFGGYNTEEYDHFKDNMFKSPGLNPLSTFSIDVDGASYSNLRRYLLQYGQKPPVDAVRIEEMVNYFSYQYKEPKGEHPFSIMTEVASAPWNSKHKLVHIGLQGQRPDYESLKPSNLVFLIDVSGSMSDQNKLPLLKSSFKLMLNELRPNDRVAIVVYAGAAGLVLPSTKVSEKESIIQSLERLSAGGSTAGGAGIALAYKVARENYLENGNNRVILATDGDFNVGSSSTSELVRRIEKERQSGIFLTIAGFGMGNYKDGRMEQISNAGNGNYYYIDNLSEARKVFVTELRATLFTIAKDVKIQVEFNPEKVAAYRLIGYENRMLNNEDFNDDKKDAGELGAGHTVTALYEIIPVGIESEFIKDVDPLKYQQVQKGTKRKSDELLTVKFRYKKPEEDNSNLIVETLNDSNKEWKGASESFRWSAAVAEFGMLLRDSEFKGQSSYSQVLEIASGAKGEDKEGYRSEFIRMVKSLELIAVR